MTAHRYWRLDVSATQGGLTLVIAELILRTSVGGSDVAIGHTASASTTNGNNVPANAFDGNPATIWAASSSAEPQWLKVDLGSAMSIVEYAITNYSASVGTSPKNFTLSYSDDDVAYIVADTETGIVWSSGGQTQTWEIGGSSSNTATASSSLGSLASSASATLAMAVAASCGLGALSCGAAVTQSQAATAQPQLGAVETFASAAQSQAATGSSTLGALATAITVQQVNVNTATIVATLGPLSSGAALTQSQAATGASALSPLSAPGNATQAQQAAAGSALPNFWCDASALASNQAQVTATLSPLFTAITATTHPTYIGDGRYYVALPVRPFYASLPPRSFYAQLPARSFYIMSDPNMTPTFEDKDPREDVVLTFDASADLATGETLTGTPTVQVTVLKGTDAGAQNIVGAPVINTQAVSVKLRNGSTVTVPANQGVQVPALNGLDACEYLIAVTCSTSNPAKKLTMKSVLPVTAY